MFHSLYTWGFFVARRSYTQDGYYRAHSVTEGTVFSVGPLNVFRSNQ